jgi:hypothetical protein
MQVAESRKAQNIKENQLFCLKIPREYLRFKSVHYLETFVHQKDKIFINIFMLISLVI